MPHILFALVGGCAVTIIAGAAMADPPGRVGRISDVEGDVSFMPPGQEDWAWAERNFPVTAGESFWTEDAGRIELQAGVMDIRADSDTELDVLALDYGQTRLGLTQGSIDLRLWRLPDGGVTVATPAGDVEINAPGIYRIDVGAEAEDGSYPPVELTVLEGEASAPGPQGFADIGAGDAALIYAGYDPEFTYAEDAAIDDWAREREQGERWDSQAAFAPSMTGYEDLAGQGEFASDPTYGTVWFPASVPQDWAPYRFGHWAWVEPWGYTWIDDEPWGFAPFHYGRWVQIEGRWGWTPGRPAAQSVYAPALVAFFGFGASIGWAPLAPDEAYRPTYEVSDDYWRRLNATSVRPEVIQNLTINTTVKIASYRNAGAAVVVGSDTLSRGGRVQTAATRVAPEQLAQAAEVRPRAVAPPAAGAIAGGSPRVSATGASRAVAPPSRLQAVRASVAAQPPGSNRPAAIPGARIAPPQSRPAGVPAFIAPAQKKNPELQARRPLPPPEVGPRSNGPATGQTGQRSPPSMPLSAQPLARPQSSPSYPAPRPQTGTLATPQRPMTRPTPGTNVQPNVHSNERPPSRAPLATPSETVPPVNTGPQRQYRPQARPEETAPPQNQPAGGSPQAQKEKKTKPDEKPPPQ